MLKFCISASFTILLPKNCVAHLGIFFMGTLGGGGIDGIFSSPCVIYFETSLIPSLKTSTFIQFCCIKRIKQNQFKFFCRSEKRRPSTFSNIGPTYIKKLKQRQREHFLRHPRIFGNISFIFVNLIVKATF